MQGAKSTQSHRPMERAHQEMLDLFPLKEIGSQPPVSYT
jgi:hypothetical protein